MIKDQILLVLRNRQQVEGALVNYHNELNHLDVNKCLRLLNERLGRIFINGRSPLQVASRQVYQFG